MQRAIVIFANSAGALLLAMATALFVVNWTSPADYVPPHDPVFLLSLRDWFWIIGGIVAVTALICFFNERLTLPAGLLLWLAVNYLVCRTGLSFWGCPGLTGYLGGFTYAFGIRAKATGWLLDTAFLYLLAGSMTSWVWLWLKGGKSVPCQTIAASQTEDTITRLNDRPTKPSDVPTQPTLIKSLKIPCPTCGGRIEIPTSSFGEQIPCPHCQAVVALQQPVKLKMSCGFCQGHLEFPDYGLGQKNFCPHCEADIVLTTQGPEPKA